MINQGLIKSTSMIFRKPLPQVVHSFGPIAENALFAKAMWGGCWMLSLGADSKYRKKISTKYPELSVWHEWPWFSDVFPWEKRCVLRPATMSRSSWATWTTQPRCSATARCGGKPPFQPVLGDVAGMNIRAMGLPIFYFIYIYSIIYI